MPQIDLFTLLELVGDLRDSDEPGNASERFRKYLRENLWEIREVRAYVDAALSRPGDQFNKALQDLINHIGQLLGFQVTYGRYRGVKGSVGFDGLWHSPTGWAIVVETKTTDAYTVKTATLLGYINALISDRRIEDSTKALGLYVYGRYDTQAHQLENAIVAEGRRERLRVIGVRALLDALELKQKYNLEHNTILSLFLPSPVRIDPLIGLILTIVAQSGGTQTQSRETAPEKAGQGQRATTLVRIGTSYTGKKVKAVVFQGERYEVSTWREATLTLIEALIRRDRERFERVAVTLVGWKRPYISSTKNELRGPRAIPGTSLYIETNLSANTLARLCYTMLAKMGYHESDLHFEITPSYLR